MNKTTKNGEWLETSRGDFLFEKTSNGLGRVYGAVIHTHHNTRWSAHYHNEGQPMNIIVFA